VKFLLQINPHNPYGVVYSIKREVGGIAEVCLRNQMFLVDDLIYRDLVYDRNKMALPTASIPEYQDITISLYGLSKSYGLASFRAAFIDAPIIVKRALAKINYQELDAISVLQSAALEGAYNSSNKRYKVYRRYFSKIMKKYEFNFYLVYGLIYGVDKVKKYKRRVRRYIGIGRRTFLKGEREFSGISMVKMVSPKLPESGFYVVLDFSEVLGKTYRGEAIKSDHEFLAILMRHAGVRFISGSGMNHYGVENHIYARVSFGLSPLAILQGFMALYKVLREIK
jgi:aspartate aminotransferase